jgi:hypothetical protein
MLLISRVSRHFRLLLPSSVSGQLVPIIIWLEGTSFIEAHILCLLICEFKQISDYNKLIYTKYYTNNIIKGVTDLVFKIFV